MAAFFIILFILLLIFAGIFSPLLNEFRGKLAVNRCMHAYFSRLGASLCIYVL